MLTSEIDLSHTLTPHLHFALTMRLHAGDKMLFARRVGLDLYNFLAGFATQAAGDAILMPTNALDR